MVAGKKLVSSASLWQGKLSTSWAVSSGVWPADGGKGFIPSLHPLWDHLCRFSSSFGPPSTRDIDRLEQPQQGCIGLAVTLWSYASICTGISVWMGHWHLILLIWNMGVVWDVTILCSETAEVTKNCLLALVGLDCARGALFTSVWDAACWERLLLRANTCNVEESGST